MKSPEYYEEESFLEIAGTQEHPIALPPNVQTVVATFYDPQETYVRRVLLGDTTADIEVDVKEGAQWQKSGEHISLPYENAHPKVQFGTVMRFYLPEKSYTVWWQQLTRPAQGPQLFKGNINDDVIREIRNMQKEPPLLHPQIVM